MGLYNITWAITNASAFFIGGALIDKLGYQCIFYVPLALMLVQFALIFWLEKIYPHRSGTGFQPVSSALNNGAKHSKETHRQDASATTAATVKNFQRMAWLANPFAYIAINTLIAVVPGLAAKFHLSPMMAGIVCSLWCFARVFAFIGLWQWPGWHYRFRWLVSAFGLLIVSFGAILTASHLALLLVAQIFFGAAIGLIYYSSLFYAMDAQDASSEHGGIHEAAIGVGNCLGPATGAAALWFAPQNASAGAWAVTGLLTVGLGGLLWLRKAGSETTRDTNHTK